MWYNGRIRYILFQWSLSMNLKNKKRAYTLAEIMLVILVLTIIFAAMAPIFTKRKITQYTGKYNVWKHADQVSKDAYYDPGDPSYTGQLFFGVTPSSGFSVRSEFLPLSKIVVRAGNVSTDSFPQRHLQFRCGRTSDDSNGVFAGTWYMNRRNMLLGGSYPGLNTSESIGAFDNTAIGYNALNNLVTGRSNVAVGYYALSKVATAENNVAVGYNAGRQNTMDNNVFVGANAGQGYNGEESVFIGYNAGRGAKTTVTSIDNAKYRNVAVGAYAGGGYNGANLKSSSSGINNNTVSHTQNAAGDITSIGGGLGNTAIGYAALANVTTGTENVAVGAFALQNLTTGSGNVAIGYNACVNLTTESKKTCIGANSGPRKKSQGNKGSAFLLWQNYGNGEPVTSGGATGDNVERVYIGAPPKNFPGDAILEIHNPETASAGLSQDTDSDTNSSTTTVINCNLIVNGRPFFTVGRNLYHFHDFGSYASGKPTSMNTGADLADTNKKSEVHLYGYRKGDTSGGKNYYQSCSSTGQVNSYSFSSTTKCPDLKTADYTGTSGSTGSGSTGTGGYGGGGGGGGCDDLRLEIDEPGLDPDERADRLQHFMTQCSDRNLKNIGERFDGGLNEVRKLKVYNFTFKDDKNKVPQVGVIAQELQKIFPNAVMEDQNGYLRIRWDEMFYATINAIKELDKKIVALVKRTTNVETQISQLEKENVELKAQVESLTARVNKLKAQ